MAPGILAYGNQTTMTPAQGTLVIAVNSGSNSAHTKRLSPPADLALALADRGLPATWFVPGDIDRAELADLAAISGLEIGLATTLAHHERPPVRPRLAGELSADLGRLRELGVVASCLAMEEAPARDNLDLLVGRGVHGVLIGPQLDRESLWQRFMGRPHTHGHAPRSLRWGLWQFEAGHKLDGHSARAALANLSQIVARREISVWRVDDVDLASPRVGRVLDAVRLCAQRGEVRVVTLSHVVSQIFRTRRHEPAASILRKSAA